MIAVSSVQLPSVFPLGFEVLALYSDFEVFASYSSFEVSAAHQGSEAFFHLSLGRFDLWPSQATLLLIHGKYWLQKWHSSAPTEIHESQSLRYLGSASPSAVHLG